MKKNFEDQLSRSLKKLPVYAPNDAVWNKIEADLKFNKQLKDSISNLPVHEADNKAWEHIHTNLSKTAKRINIRPIIYAFAVAACVLAFIVVFRFEKKQAVDEVIVYEELNQEWIPATSINKDEQEEDVLKFIDKQCFESSYLCQIPEFRNLQKELKEVESDILELNKTINQIGSSSSLERLQIKLENHKAQIIKQLVKQVTS